MDKFPSMRKSSDHTTKILFSFDQYRKNWCQLTHESISYYYNTKPDQNGKNRFNLIFRTTTRSSSDHVIVIFKRDADWQSRQAGQNRRSESIDIQHVPDRSQPCRFFASGRCQRAESCRFSHIINTNTEITTSKIVTRDVHVVRKTVHTQQKEVKNNTESNEPRKQREQEWVILDHINTSICYLTFHRVVPLFQNYIEVTRSKATTDLSDDSMRKLFSGKHKIYRRGEGAREVRIFFEILIKKIDKIIDGEGHIWNTWRGNIFW